MSTPPPNPWGQPTPPDPQPPQTPAAGQWNQPPPTTPQPQVTGGPPPSNGGNGKKIGIVVGVLAVIAALVVGGLALFGGDDGDGPRSTSGDDPEEAIAVAEDAVQAVLDGDCDRAEEFATRNFRDQLDALCAERYPDARITDSSLESDDPVVVLVEFEVQDAELSYPLAMEYDEDEEMWFVDSLDGTSGIPDPPDDPTDDPSDDPTEPTDPTGDPTDGGDPEDAVDAATNLVQALIELDCDQAAEYATADFAETQLDSACDEDPGTIEITDATLVDEDPVVVEVDYEGDAEGTFPFEMVYEDGEWLVADFYVGSPSGGPVTVPSDPTDDPGSSTAPTSESGDPEDAVAVAQAAIEALAAGDCDTALSYGTEFFVEFYGEDICAALPAGTSVTGAELLSETPVIVSVDTDADFGIELYMVFEDGTWLVDDYSV